MGFSTPPFPKLSFPLSSARKSGLLPPIIGLDNTNGLELSLPYYWNIAPNRDLTLIPTLMSKRGVNLGATDDLGFHVVDKPVHVHDLQATILHCLGFDHERLTFHHAGRDFRLTDVHGHVVKEILA